MVLLKLMYLNICRGRGETREREKMKSTERMEATHRNTRNEKEEIRLGGEGLGAGLGGKSPVP